MMRTEKGQQGKQLFLAEGLEIKHSKAHCKILSLK